MSRENVEIVRRLYAAVSDNDGAAVLDLYSPEIEWDFSRSPFLMLVEHEVYRGHDGIRAFLHERREEAWAEVSDELDELIDAGEHVVSVVNSGGRGRASGVEVHRTHAATWTIRNGKVIRVAWFGTVQEALEAAGLDRGR